MSIAFAEYETFAAFRADHLRHIRPDGTRQRLHRAFEIDVVFLESYGLARPYLARFQERWADAIAAHVAAARSNTGPFEPEDAAAFSRLYRLHMQHVIRGRFDDAFLDTLEDVALFMIYRDIKSVWLAGAHQKMLGDMIDLVFDRVEAPRRHRLNRIVKLLVKAMAIEMNQIQRVFTTVETHRLARLYAETQTETGFALRLDLPEPPNEPLPPATIAAVREIGAQLGQYADAVSRKFFERLFEIEPALQPLFPEDVDARRELLRDTLDRGMALLDDLGGGGDNAKLSALAAELVACGASPSRFEAIGQAWIATLASSVGRRWTPSAASAWRDAYRKLARAMIDAAPQRAVAASA